MSVDSPNPFANAKYRQLYAYSIAARVKTDDSTFIFLNS